MREIDLEDGGTHDSPDKAVTVISEIIEQNDAFHRSAKYKKGW